MQTTQMQIMPYEPRDSSFLVPKISMKF